MQLDANILPVTNRLQLRPTWLQLDTNQLQLKPTPIATGRESVATRTDPVATGRELVATRIDPVATGREPVATQTNQVATGHNSVATRTITIVATVRVGAFFIQNTPRCIIAKHYIYIYIVFIYKLVFLSVSSYMNTH